MPQDIKRHAARSGVYVVLGQAYKLLLRFGSFAFLGRLLTPGDFGQVAMVTAILGFFDIFKDGGLSTAAVQRKDLGQQQATMLFWLQLALGLSIMLVVMGLSPLVGWFYHAPGLIVITQVLALRFFVGSLIGQHQAQMQRALRFVALMWIEIFAMTTSVLVGITLAYNGGGIWALVAIPLTESLCLGLGVWLLHPWRPSAPTRTLGKEVKEMLSFGGYLSLYSLTNYFARHLDNILLGRFWGAQSLGHYSRAYALLLLPIGQVTAPITRIAIPTLSRLQHDPQRYRSFYLDALRGVAYTTIPTVFALALLSYEVIGLLLGPQWHEAGTIFRILALSTWLQGVGSTVGWIYTSLDQTKRMARFGFFSSPILILSFLVGLPWGAQGVAWTYSITILLLIYPIYAYAFAKSPIKVSDAFFVIAPVTGLSLIMLGVMWGVRATLTSNSHFLIILFTSLAGAFTFSILALLIPYTRTDVIRFVRILRRP